jgi:hypothetical protein
VRRRLRLAWVSPSASRRCSPALLPAPARAADHNDPNAVNSIFADIPVSAADLYDLFGFPSDDRAGGEKVVLALTFASVPETGVLDPTCSTACASPPRRVCARARSRSRASRPSSAGSRRWRSATCGWRRRRCACARRPGKVKVDFIGFAPAALRRDDRHQPGGGHRDARRPHHQDLRRRPRRRLLQRPAGFFRSINYAPQFYHVPLARPSACASCRSQDAARARGQHALQLRPANPQHGSACKTDLPPAPYEWKGNATSGRQRQLPLRLQRQGRAGGRNVNAIILEIPLAFLTKRRRRTASSTPGARAGYQGLGQGAGDPRPRRHAGAPWWALLLPAVLWIVGLLAGAAQRAAHASGGGSASRASPSASSPPRRSWSFFRSSTMMGTPTPSCGPYKLVDTDGLPFATPA